MLLNPAHRQGPKPSDSVRRSGGFAGLVRHVVELCALGELPVARDAGQGADGEVENDSPIGCAVEYSLPDFGHVSQLKGTVVPPSGTVLECTVYYILYRLQNGDIMLIV